MRGAIRTVAASRSLPRADGRNSALPSRPKTANLARVCPAPNTAFPLAANERFGSASGTPAISSKNRVGGLRLHPPSRARFMPREVVEDAPGCTVYSYQTVSGAHDMQARFYSPVYRRFLNEDPSGFSGGVNLYAFAGGDPVNLMDPFGLGPTSSGIGQSLLNGAASFIANASGYTNFSNGNQDFQNGNYLHGAANYVAGTVNEALLITGVGAAYSKAAGMVSSAVDGLVAEIANPVPGTLARVIPNGINTTTLGAPGAADVFVADAAQLEGQNAQQIAAKLAIPKSPTGFQVIKFPAPGEGLATPVLRTNPGFIQGGRTAGGASEFVIPNGPIPPEATTTVVH